MYNILGDLQIHSGILLHQLPCSGIVYPRIAFSLSDFTAEELVQANMLCSLFGKLPTDRCSALTLQQEIKRYTGRMGFSISLRSHPKDPSRCAPMLSAHVAVLPENVEKGLSLLAEILFHTDFSQQEKIEEIAQQIELAVDRKSVV